MMKEYNGIEIGSVYLDLCADCHAIADVETTKARAVVTTRHPSQR